MCPTPTYAQFCQLLGEVFVISDPAGGPARLELRLATVTPGGPQARPDGTVPFALLFRGPAGPILPQHIYRLEHAQLGEIQLFLIPRAPDVEGSVYEAVIN